MKLHFVIAEAALELIPETLWREPSVRNDAERRAQEPGSILLDRSIHHSAMLKLRDGYRRGRPDLVHLTLLSVTSTPLHQEGKARVYIHTIDDSVLEFGEGARPPKSYARFRNLMEKLLVERPDERPGERAGRDPASAPEGHRDGLLGWPLRPGGAGAPRCPRRGTLSKGRTLRCCRRLPSRALPPEGPQGLRQLGRGLTTKGARCSRRGRARVYEVEKAVKDHR